MCVCVCMYVCVYVCVCVCVCMCVNLQVKYISMWIICMYVCEYVRTWAVFVCVVCACEAASIVLPPFSHDNPNAMGRSIHTIKFLLLL